MFDFLTKFKFDEERDEYVAELNGIEFVCDEPQECYKKKLRSFPSSTMKGCRK